MHNFQNRTLGLTVEENKTLLEKGEKIALLKVLTNMLWNRAFVLKIVIIETSPDEDVLHY